MSPRRTGQESIPEGAARLRIELQESEYISLLLAVSEYEYAHYDAPNRTGC
jgi:hypothetical protein